MVRQAVLDPAAWSRVAYAFLTTVCLAAVAITMAEKLVTGNEVMGAVDHLEESINHFLLLRSIDPYDHADIVFENVSVEGRGRGVQVAPTVRTAAWSFLNTFNPFGYKRHPESSRTLLHEFSGTVKGGEMLLVVGKPGSGCTTFLKTMSGMCEEYKDTTGVITYGGKAASEVTKHSPADIVYCAEDDDHFPTLTVREVLRFALRSRWISKASASNVENAVERLAELVGLHKVLNTKVGDSYVRGVSGGERRRVSLAEALATCAMCICLDSPTNGLDSTTALEFIKMMRSFTDRLRCATAMSIYQGSDSMVSLFDKAVVINNGRQIYYGQASGAKAYFESLGFECAPTVTITDFLNSMTAGPEARRPRRGYENRVPVTAQDFENSFRASEFWKTALTDISTSKRAPARSGPGKRLSYTLPFYHQILLCAYRQARVFITDYHTWGSEAIIISVQSVLLGTVYRDLRRRTSSFPLLEAALFYAILVPALQSMAEFQNTFAQQGLILKHKRYRFYRPSAYAFGLITTDLVWKVVAIAYNIPLYWLAGFQRTPGHFFIWFLTAYVAHMALSMIFRFLAVLSPNANGAILPVGLLFNSFVLYVGLYIPPPEMRAWLGWLRYLNPLYYGFGSLMINEFSNLDYVCSEADLAPNGLGYGSIANQVCAVPGAAPGQGFVSGAAYLRAQYGFHTSDMWRNIAINAAFFVAFAVSTAIGMEFLKLPAGKLATVFYKAEPKDLAGIKSSASSDTERGSVDEEDVPPVTSRQTLSMSLQKEQSIRHDQHVFAWKDTCVDVKIGDMEKRLLDQVDGWAENGQLTALMGVSGAGKTTLLNTLAGRLNFGTLSGDLFLDGQPLPKSFGRYMGYVQQEDVHLPTQTVREALRLTAHLRRPAEISKAEKDAYVELVIDMLEMEDFADALIGVPGAGLNLRQRKQVTIGVELAARPDILFLDEPSSGLDGQSALSIVRLLRKLADLGQAVVCTIHQPAAELICYFDTLFLLTTGGRTVYHGPLGKDCSLALEYFSTYGRTCGERENPAEYFLDVIGAGSRSTASNDWAEIWRNSDTRRERATILESKAAVTKNSQISRAKFDRTYGASFVSQLKVVLHRTWLFYWREPDYVSSKLWMHVGNALINSLTFLQSPNTVRGARNRVFSIFMALIISPPLGLQVMPRFVALRDIFIHREKASLTYHWAVFVLSAIIVEIPYAFFAGLIYWLLWYFPVGYFDQSSRAGYSFLMYELLIVFATSAAQLSAAVMPQLTAAFTANGCLFVLLNTFTGTLTPEPITPSGWRWFYKISPLFYLSEGLNVNALQDLPVRCAPDETNVFEPPLGSTCGAYARDFLNTATGYLVNPEADSSCTYCRYQNGQSYFEQFGYRWTNRYRDIGILIGFIAFNYTSVIVATYLTKVHKWKWKWKRT